MVSSAHQKNNRELSAQSKKMKTTTATIENEKKNLTTFDTILDPNLINVDRRGNTKCYTELHESQTAQP